jgi:proteasome lid subunit RPN8/RPN11
LAVRVRLDRKVLNKIKKEAKHRFPNECYGVLFGEVTNGGLSHDITDVWFPPDIEKYSTPMQVTIPVHWWDRAMLYAAPKRLMMCGDVHSHCFTRGEPWLGCGAPSETDYDSSPLSGHHLQGIVLVREQKNKHKRATLRFWPNIDPPKLEVV